MHILTAFCTENRISLGQETVAGKENEIVAIPRLLDLICIENSIVTIDAMGCQKAIAKKIRANEAHYILQVKNNQKTLLEDIEDSFAVKKQLLLILQKIADTDELKLENVVLLVF